MESGYIEIIPAAEEHIERIHKCLDSVARERLFLLLVEAPSLQASEEFIKNNIRNDNPQFIAVLNDEIIGWCDIVPLPYEGFRHSGHLGMGVRKDFRGVGLGKKLLDAAVNKAREKGLERIELEVFASNKMAVRLYRKSGFVEEGIKRKARKTDGHYDDIIQMAMFI